MTEKIAALSSNTSKPSLTSSAAAAETVVSNLDLLTEILVRVPAKSLIKFKSVSKQWLSLISNSQFSRNHTTHRNPPPLPSAIYFYSNRDRSLSLNDQITSVSVNGHQRTSFPNLSFLDGSGFEFSAILHSSNGLMLFSIQEMESRKYVVCNLTTQRFVVLPTIAVGSESYYHFSSYLVFDPKKSPYYKVALVRNTSDRDTTQLAVYSSESGSWKTTTLGPMTLVGMEHGALWNGSAIILMRCKGGGDCAAHDHVYFRFDIDAQKLTTTRVSPPESNLSKQIMYFGECGDHLLLIQISQYNAAEFTVLEMMVGETDFRWTVKYVVDLAPLILPKRKGCKFTVISVLKVSENESDLAVVLYIRGKIVQYNIECKTVKVLCDSPKGIFSNFYRHMPSFHFIESLMPV